jgi:hypothetical protein
MEEELLNKILIKVVDIDERLKQTVTHEQFSARFDDAMTSIDRFAKLHETLDQELVALRSKYDRLEERLIFVENKLGIKTL